MIGYRKYPNTLKSKSTIVDFSKRLKSWKRNKKFNDIYSILLVYENYDSFFIKINQDKNSYAFTKGEKK